MTTKNSIEYDYTDAAHKHAVTSLGTGENYTYDANGNMDCRSEGGVTYKQTYDVENRLTTVSKMSGGCAGTILETTSFVYDGDGNLVKKTDPNGSKTLYVGGVYEVDKSSGGAVTATRNYYPAAGAMRVNNTIYYIRKDHLGSASAVTDASGTILGEQLYYPFGQTRYATGSMYTDRLYTGQREISSLGIYYYNARFYSPYINHFISADTIVPNPVNPQSLNRYSYVNNNPLRYTDPTGHYCVEEDADGNIIHMNCGSWEPIGGGGNGGGGLDEDEDDEPDLHIELGNPSCDSACEQMLEGLFVAAAMYDSIALGVNFTLAVGADLALALGGPLAYGEALIIYQGLSVVPNLIGSAGGAIWIASGLLSGETHIEMTVNNGMASVSGSVAQDTIATIIVDGLGWSPVARDPNVATTINAVGVGYDIARNPFAPMLPTIVQTTFSFTINTGFP